MTRDQGTRDDAEHSRWLDDQLKQPGMIDMRGMSAEQADAALVQAQTGDAERQYAERCALAERLYNRDGTPRDQHEEYDELSARRIQLARADAADYEDRPAPPERFIDVKGYTDELLAQGLAGAAIRGEQRSARAGAAVDRLMADRARAVNADNREAALKSLVDANGVTQYFTTCVCRWHGLQVTDPELARREYDVHPCSAPSGDAIHRTYRGPIDKRPRSTMRPAFSVNDVTLSIEVDLRSPSTFDDNARHRIERMLSDMAKEGVVL